MALTTQDAAIVLGMLARGDANHDIAAWFGVNPARIAEVKSGDFGPLNAAPQSDLPAKGAVGPKARRLRSQVKAAIDTLKTGGSSHPKGALEILEEALAKFNKNET